MDADYPISKCCDDRLGRTHLALHVADMLRAAPADHSIVFGLSGSWGSGKTSVLNMVRELLEKDDDPPVIVHFNPWNYPVGTDLVRPFLNLLASEIRNARSGEAAKKLAEDVIEAIGDYANALDPIIPPQLGVLGGLAHIFSTRRKKALSQKTPEELKRQLVDKLLLLHLRIVVMIDDLDRLPNEMVCAVFQLVAAVADFPRVSYLLSYDRKNVVRALHKVQKCDGDEYLEKIVQVPLELPQPSIGALSAMVEEGAGKILSSAQLDDDEWKRVDSAVNGDIPLEVCDDIVDFLKTDISVCDAILSIDFQDHASVLDGFRRIITVLSESKDPQHQDEYVGSLTPEEAQLEYGYSQVLNSLQGMMMYLRDEL